VVTSLRCCRTILHLRNRGGFNDPELLIVIAILGILLAVTLPIAQALAQRYELSGFWIIIIEVGLCVSLLSILKLGSIILDYIDQRRTRKQREQSSTADDSKT
jgi:prepilin-type N-terminal cleavage/methylation domain-containing protein